MRKTALLIEDERDVAELVRHALAREGFEVHHQSDGARGLAAVEREHPDILILDVMLPTMDGFEICRRLRRDARTAAIPIIMLTARAEDADHVAGLEVGADDYVTKPFSPRVLVAHIRALLRRAAEPVTTAEVITAGAIRIDSGRHEILVDGAPVALTATEFKILRFLASRPGRVRTRLEIVENVSGDVAVLERTVDAHLTALRRKLGSAGELVETVRGVGYRLREA